MLNYQRVISIPSWKHRSIFGVAACCLHQGWHVLGALCLRNQRLSDGCAHHTAGRGYQWGLGRDNFVGIPQNGCFFFWMGNLITVDDLGNTPWLRKTLYIYINYKYCFCVFFGGCFLFFNFWDSGRVHKCFVCSCDFPEEWDDDCQFSDAPFSHVWQSVT